MKLEAGDLVSLRYHRGLHYFAWFTVAATFILIVAGGLVTSKDAGLSVPDWPLSFGSLNPPMVGGVAYEHTHRVIAASVGILMIILFLWVRWRDPRTAVRRLALVALAAVIVQGLLGGMTVLLGLPPAVSILHACLAQGFFCMTVALAVLTSRRWIEHVAGEAPEQLQRGPGFYAAAATVGLIFLQLILGATLRHLGTVDGAKAVEFSFPAFIAHLVGALFVVVFVIFTALSISRISGTHSPLWMGQAMLALVAFQLIMGLGAYLVRIGSLNATHLFGPLVTTFHLAIGALLLAMGLALSLRLSHFKPEPAVAGSEELRLAGDQL
jgi:heme a synthase